MFRPAVKLGWTDFRWSMIPIESDSDWAGCPTGLGLTPSVNCEEYLDFFARSYGLRGKDRLRALRNVMGFTQLDQLAEKPVDGLSKGMKQRLCLSRALIHNPKVLILDEPAAGLDPRARIELREMISELSAEGKSLLISSHILTELAEMCDRVGIIEQGEMLAVGTVEEILSEQTDDSENEGLTQVVAVVLSDTEVAVQWLRQETGVADVRIVQSTIQFSYDSSLDAQAELLKRMIGQEIRIASFTGKQKSLEDVFLTVTRGRVQ